MLKWDKLFSVRQPPSFLCIFMCLYLQIPTSTLLFPSLSLFRPFEYQSVTFVILSSFFFPVQDPSPQHLLHLSLSLLPSTKILSLFLASCFYPLLCIWTVFQFSSKLFILRALSFICICRSFISNPSRSRFMLITQQSPVSHSSGHHRPISVLDCRTLDVSWILNRTSGRTPWVRYGTITKHNTKKKKKTMSREIIEPMTSVFNRSKTGTGNNENRHHHALKSRDSSLI